VTGHRERSSLATEIRAGASYLLTRNFSLIGQWHSQFGWGGGLRWQF